ncbi:MAG: hypothetical protein ACI4KH_02165 [Oscillospiraceae bacterium]
MSIKIDTIMLRYFVPFGYKCDSESMFSESVRKIRETAGKAPLYKSGENDFFANINELYSENNPAGIGEYIEYGNNLPRLCSSDGKYTLDFTRCGVYLNRNGLGILWYEVKPDDAIIGDVHTLYSFQNSFKELTVHKNPFMWQRTERKKSEFVGKAGTKRVINDSDEIVSLAEKFGLEMTDKMPEKAVILEDGKTVIEYTETSDFHKGLWINGLLNKLDGLHFIPERYKGENKTPIPDKALLCSYTLFSADTDEERFDYMFRMTAGYNENYIRSTDTENQCLHPFGNTWWFARHEGVGQFVLFDSNEKHNAFHRDLALKRMDNYCYLYVLVLQQYYSLLEFSERIGKLSAVTVDGKRKKHLKELHRCIDDMNLFYMKNTFPGISHISHQNDIYKYIRDIYDINEFYEETKKGIDAITDMLEKSDSESSSDRLFLCTIIGAMFLIAETVANLSDIVSSLNVGEAGSLVWWLYVGAFLGISVVVSLFVWIIWKRWKK